MPTDQTDAAVAFLRLLGLEYSLLHLSLDSGARRLRNSFLSAKDDAGLRTAVGELLALNAAQESSVVFGVNERVRARGTDMDVPFVNAMAVDYDAEKVVGPERLNRFMELVPPTVVSASGGSENLHVYWRLRNPVPAASARRLVYRLCKWLGADPSWSPAKMMRLPGSFSWKHGEPRLVSLTHVDPDARTTLDAFGAGLEALEVPVVEPSPMGARRSARRGGAATARGLPPASPDDVEELLVDLPPWTRDLIVRGKVDSDRFLSRSEADFSVVSRLLEVGTTDDDIHAVFAAYQAGIGARAHEQGVGYLDRTIEEARRRLKIVPLRVVGVRGTAARMVLDLRVLDGPQEGLTFSQGVDAGSTAWPWIFRHAGAAVPQTLDERMSLVGRTLGATLGLTTQGNWQVLRWSRRQVVQQ